MIRKFRKVFKSGALAVFIVLGVLALAQSATNYLEVDGGGLVFRTTDPEVKFVGNMEFEKIGNVNGNVNINSSGTGHFRFNSRAYTGTSGTAMGFQSKPDQTAVGASVTGAEISPRYTDAGGGDLIGMKLDPVIKDATTARTVNTVRGLEMNFDLPNAGSAYTVTNDVSAIRIFPDFGSGHTFSGRRSILLAAAPNTSDWQYLLEAETGTNGWVVATAGTYSTADGYFVVRVHGTDRRVPFFNAVD